MASADAQDLDDLAAGAGTRSGDAAETGSGGRGRLIDIAIRAWKNQLVDLSARNNLLYYRTLKVGTLDFTGSETFVDQVLDGRVVRLSSVFSAAVPRQPFEKRARAIRNKAKEAFEERGLDTLFLACGMATWDEESERRTAPRAPVTLVPMSLDPIATGMQDFELRMAGEPRVNPTLLRKLESEFGVPIVAEQFDAELLNATSTYDLAAVFGRITQLAPTVPGFAIENQTVLGTFSYAKLPMVLDLDRAREELIQHDLIAALCGDPEARVSLSERNAGSGSMRLDEPDRMPPSSEFLVLDADSSQSLAVNRVLAGHDLIVQGPPGTGKSQTIANLIANGKTVLFVAEKRAAIDAVFKRLRQVDLGDLLLDMHDGQKKRAPFAAELMQAIRAQGGLPAPALADEHRALTISREQLSGRSAAQHSIREPWGVSIYDARVRIAGLPELAATELRVHGDELQALTAEVLREARERLRRWYELDALEIRREGRPWAHATAASPAESDQAAAAAREALKVLRAMAPFRARFTAASMLPQPETAASWDEQLDLAAEAIAIASVFDMSVFDHDLGPLVEALAPWEQGGIARARGQITSGEYRSAKKLIRGLSRGDADRIGHGDRVAWLGRARDLQRAWLATAGEETKPVVVSDFEEVSEARQQLRIAVDRLTAFVPSTRLADAQFASLEQLLVEMTSTDLRTLAAIAEINPIERWFGAQHLDRALADIEHDGLMREEAIARIDYVWLMSIIELLTLSESETLGPRGPTPTVVDFQRQDRRHIDTGPVRVRRACAERAVAARDEHRDQGLLVERQAKLKPRSPKHLPIRDFFAQAPDVIRTLKPCWAMSPLVVSQTLPAQRELFDVVIFDEASQVTPADAIPAVLRGRQLVVAGDSRQLPPTSFFVSAAEELEDEEDIPADAGTEGYESILDALTGLIPEQMLTWHYRSRDERLIAFSNAYIYDRALTTFPGAVDDDVVGHVLVDPRPDVQMSSQDGSADEVGRVVELILEHAQERPDESLGVIAMGIKHADRISECLRRRREDMRENAQDSADADDLEVLDEFFAENRDEPFFVKNLERVQGDERDAIILTIGYGKDPATGRMAYRFGPLLQDGGERRLNVAITRAKQRMTVVSSFTAGDLDPDKLNKEGTKLLRMYLAYAESRGRSLGERQELPPALNPFEIQVRDELVKAGLDVTAQHGVSGYRIDFAVKHPEQPGRYVLALECDGARYHSSPTARERDRLRQQHLERLGWRFCRIWSSDWFNDRARETQRILYAYDDAVAAADREEPPDPFDCAAGAPPPVTAPSAVRVGPCPNVWDQYNPRQLEAVVRWVETDTLLRTRDELFWDTLRALGYTRAGNRIRPAVETAIAAIRGPYPDTASSPPHILSPGPSAPPAPSNPIPPVAPTPPPASPPSRSQPPPSRPVAPQQSSRVPIAADLAATAAARIRYLSKSGYGSGSVRVVNPLHFKGDLMWAWCHKRRDVRCFNITRISEWQPVDETEWAAPDVAKVQAWRTPQS